MFFFVRNDEKLVRQNRACREDFSTLIVYVPIRMYIRLCSKVLDSRV